MTFHIKKLKDNHEEILKFIKSIDKPLIKEIMEYGYEKARRNTYDHDDRIKDRYHEAVLCKHNERDINIDKKIVPLITEIWKVNINTTNSCQNNVPANYVWIEFMTTEDCNKFLNIIIQNINRSSQLYSRVVTVWIYDTNINIQHDEKVNINFYQSVRFPDSDLEMVTQIMTKYNEKQQQSL